MCRYLLQQQVALLSKCVSSLSMKTGHLLSTIGMLLAPYFQAYQKFSVAL